MDSYFLLFNKTTATEFSPAAQRNPPFIPLYKQKGERGGFGVRESFFADSVTHKQCKFQVCLAGLPWPKDYVSTLTKQSRDCKK
jgi:hypothetical protein